MKEPIFAYEPDSLLVFETVWKAERYIEPVDANDSIYFDAEGKVLIALVEKDDRGIERTVITESENIQYKAAELRNLIVGFLQYLDYTEQQLENKSLTELVKESIKFKTE